MRAEFVRPDAPNEVAGVATWDGTRVHVESEDEGIRSTLARVFRVSPVQIFDPAATPESPERGALVEPGDLEWFRSAALVRGREEGLGIRFATDVSGGWDPAGSYEPMDAFVGRREGDAAGQPTLGTSRA
jgi:hypothetical protein